MKWSKLDYRISLSYYNACRRIRAWFKPEPLVSEPKSIMVGATVLLGDLVMQGPLIQALRRRYPHAKITLLVPKGWRDFARAMLGVDDALEAELNHGRWLRKFRREHQGQWDLGVVPLVYPLIPFFYGVGIRNILSFPDPKGRRRYQIHRCAGLPVQAGHMSRMMLALLDERDSRYPAPHLQVSGLALPGNLQGQSYVVIHPGASLPTRFWPSARYVLIAEQLLASGYHIVLTGSKGEIHLADAIAKHLPEHSVTSLAGKTNLLELTNVLQHAKAILGPDTGVLHIAKALAVPSVTLLGPTQKEIYGLDPNFHDVSHARTLYVPDLACRDSHTAFKQLIPGIANCRRKQCLYPDNPCLLGIEVAAVLSALTEINLL